jgi:hypothetical protein
MWIHTHVCGGRQVHQVDRSKAGRLHNDYQDTRVRLRDHVPVRRPNNIIIDNETQFTARELKDFCDNMEIMVNYASVCDPTRVEAQNF